VWGRVEDITDEEFDRILHVNPAGLIIGPHVRVHPRLDKEFLASIETDDVEEVDTVYRNQERTSSSLWGQRRTAGAVTGWHSHRHRSRPRPVPAG